MKKMYKLRITFSDLELLEKISSKFNCTIDKLVVMCIEENGLEYIKNGTKLPEIEGLKNYPVNWYDFSEINQDIIDKLEEHNKEKEKSFTMLLSKIVNLRLYFYKASFVSG